MWVNASDSVASKLKKKEDSGVYQKQSEGTYQFQNIVISNLLQFNTSCFFTDIFIYNKQWNMKIIKSIKY